MVGKLDKEWDKAQKIYLTMPNKLTELILICLDDEKKEEKSLNAF